MRYSAPLSTARVPLAVGALLAAWTSTRPLLAQPAPDVSIRPNAIQDLDRPMVVSVDNRTPDGTLHLLV